MSDRRRQEQASLEECHARMEQLAGDLRRVLGTGRVLCAAVESRGTLRFVGVAPAGEHIPAALQPEEVPDLAAALKSGGMTRLTKKTATLLGGRYAVAVPWLVDGDAAGVCVLVSDRDMASETAPLMEAVGRQNAEVMALSRERDGLKRRVAELERSVGAFRALVERTSDAVMLVDLDGRVRVWNPACERMFGWGVKEVIGKVLPHMPPAGRRRAIADLRRIASLGDVQDAHTTAHRKDGSYVTFAATAISLSDSDELPFGVLTVVRDIESDSRVPQMQADFLSLVTQEMRNPLTAILGYVQLLARPEIWEDSARRARTLRALESRGQQMASLIDDLLVASRIDQGELKLQREPVDLPAVVTETVTRFEQFQTRHRFLIDVDTRVPRIEGDARRLGQAVTNLLLNAVKYSPENGDVRMSVLRDGDNAVISVSDEGVGIPDAEMERVFDKFYKTETSRGLPGAGLGLYLVKMIAEGHGGSVVVESVPGEGSTFAMRLPVGR